MFEDVRSRLGMKVRVTEAGKKVESEAEDGDAYERSIEACLGHVEDSVGVKLRNSLLQVSDVEDEVEGEVEGEFEGVGVGGGESEG